MGFRSAVLWCGVLLHSRVLGLGLEPSVAAGARVEDSGSLVGVPRSRALETGRSRHNFTVVVLVSRACRMCRTLVSVAR